MYTTRRPIREVCTALYMLARYEVGAILYLLLFLSATLLVRVVACLSLHACLIFLIILLQLYSRPASRKLLVNELVDERKPLKFIKIQQEKQQSNRVPLITY